MIAKTMIAAGILAMLVPALPMQAQAASRAQCEDYASRVAYREDNGGRDVARGAVGGAAAGAALGAILGNGRGRNIGKGAIIGGVAGTALGATRNRGGYVDRSDYNRAYRDCMRENTYRVRRDNSDEQYCLARFRSYNPETGMYRTYSGEMRSCP